MINYGKTVSKDRPDDVEVRETMVFTASNIKEVTVTIEDDKVEIQYEFDYIGYDKDEYIKMMVDTNTDLNAELTDAQLALCELYEMILGE